ncbi:MAG: Hpt domain-containing protein [Alteromonadaceae bacterium]|nr:Hpt domain-containing protein [Alteromonadaceae bacterium]
MNNTQLDLNLLENYRSNLGKEVLMKMLALYRQQGEIYLADIEQALSHNEPQQWQEHCHKMKGASGSVGLKQVHALLVDMEKSQAEQAIKNKKLQELQQLNKIAIVAFEQWLTDNS